MSWSYTSNLSRINEAVRENSEQALFEAAGDIAVSAAVNAPVDTGELEDSYQKDSAVEQVGELEYLVGSDVEHALYVEFGTTKMDAQPHLIPAFVENRRNVKQKLANAAQKAV